MAVSPPPLLRRRTALTLALLGLIGQEATARDTSLPRPASLRQSASEAQRQGEPLVVLISLPGCPYCELIRRNYLAPMRQQGLHAVQVDVNDRRHPVADFRGQASTGHDLSRAWRARITPTVMFFNEQGEEVAPRIEGVAVVDFFGAYLEDRLATARSALKRQGL
jgi:thioredoxin-related protein